MIHGEQKPFEIKKSVMFNGFFARPDMNFREDIKNSTKGIKRILKKETDPLKRSALKVIRKEMKLLKLQLDNL